ncbi:MAG: M48 family metalloprotease [Synergistaceae bacterium]|jgi:Zn-dependent protease with chaperone function|nr:M48 family metalloprotease [Synergistaceae bacterium]
MRNDRKTGKKALAAFLLVVFPVFALWAGGARASERQNAPLPAASLSSDSGVSGEPAPRLNSGEISDPELLKERAIGRKIAERIEKDEELVADPALLARFSMILDSLAPHLERKIPYEIRILRSDVPNAFCLPGGFVFFTTRMLELLHSDAEIAAVLAHEMIHVDQKHGMKMAAQANKLSLAALAVILASGGAVAPAVLAQVAQVAIVSGYGIEFEKEADSKGLDVLIAAGYPPAAMVTVMEGFVNEEMKRPVRDYGIYMNHPESIDRVKSLSEKLKSLHIALERKHPLRLLQTSVETDALRVRLLIDGVEVWGGVKSASAVEAIERAKEILDRDFQMELAPYDLRLEGAATPLGAVLRLKNNLLAQEPLPEGMTSLADFRKNLLSALARAQGRSPWTRYGYGGSKRIALPLVGRTP